MKKSDNKIWINTRVELQWDGDRYIETLVEGYWYDGPLALAIDYERTLTSALDATDPQARELQALRKILDQLGMTDGDAERILEANYTTQNQATVSDSLIRTIESASITYTRILTSGVDVEDLTLRDLVRFYSVVIEDGIDIDDAIISEVVRLYIRILEASITVDDQLSRSLARVANRLLTDGVDANDLSLVYESLTRGLIAPVTANDLVIRDLFLTYARNLADDLTITDALSREVEAGNVLSRVLLAAFSVVDGDAERLAEYNYKTVNSATIADLIISTVTSAGVVERLLTDGLSIEDAIIRTLTTLGDIDRVMSDSISVFDLSADSRYYALSFFDGMDISDAQSRSIYLNRFLANSVDVVDALSRLIQALVIDRDLTDSIEITDILVKVSAVTKILFSYLGIADNIALQRHHERALADNVDILDVIIRTISGAGFIDRTLLDNIDLYDSAERQLSLARALTSVAVVVSEIARDADIIRLLQDDAQLFDDVIRLVSRPLWEYTLRDDVELLDLLSREKIIGGQIIALIKAIITQRNIDIAIEKASIDTGISKP